MMEGTLGRTWKRRWLQGLARREMQVHLDSRARAISVVCEMGIGRIGRCGGLVPASWLAAEARGKFWLSDIKQLRLHGEVIR